MSNFEFLPTIKVYEVDYKFIISNYLNRELWDKEWTLFQYKNFVFTLSLERINTKSKDIIFKVRLTSDLDIYSNSSCSEITYRIGVTTIEQLKNIIKQCMWNRILSLETNYIQTTDEYDSIKRGWDEQKDILTKIAKDFLDENNVENKEIRNAYIDYYVNENDHLWNDLQKYESSMKFRCLTELYLVFAKAIKDEDAINEVAEAQVTDITKLLSDVQDAIVYLETDDYTDEMRDLLPAI